MFQLEILPVLIARRLWSSRCSERALLTFCDNEAAKGALVAAYSPQPLAAAILSEVANCDVKDGALVWYDRVPTSSNVADAPSRMEVPERIDGWDTPIELNVDDLLLDTLGVVRANAIKLNSGTASDPRLSAPGVADPRPRRLPVLGHLPRD